MRKSSHTISHCAECPFFKSNEPKPGGVCEYLGGKYVQGSGVPNECPVAQGREIQALVVVGRHEEPSRYRPTGRAAAPAKREVPPLRFHGQSSTALPPCPECNAPMRHRQRRRDGAPFLGCSTYPDCGGTRPIEDDDYDLARSNKRSMDDYGVDMIDDAAEF